MIPLIIDHVNIGQLVKIFTNCLVISITNEVLNLPCTLFLIFNLAHFISRVQFSTAGDIRGNK